jgi:hypothetical protein
MYELSSTWASYDSKKERYSKLFTTDFYLVGKYNKYPALASSARDTVHWCKRSTGLGHLRFSVRFF